MNGNPQPSTAKEAAIRILLGEVGPLLDRAELAGTTLREAHELIAKDLESMGVLVATVDRALADTLDEVGDLVNQVRDIKAKASIPPVVPLPPKGLQLKTIWLVSITSSLIAAAITAAIVVLISHQTLEQARVGRAISNALPYMDTATKQKLQSAIQKAGS